MQISSQKQIQKTKSKSKLLIQQWIISNSICILFIYFDKKQIIFLYILYLFIPYPETGRIEGGKIV